MQTIRIEIPTRKFSNDLSNISVSLKTNNSLNDLTLVIRLWYAIILLLLKSPQALIRWKSLLNHLFTHGLTLSRVSEDKQVKLSNDFSRFTCLSSRSMDRYKSNWFHRNSRVALCRDKPFLYARFLSKKQIKT